MSCKRILLLTVCALLGGCATPAKMAPGGGRGEVALANGDYQGSLPYLEAAVRKEPTSCTNQKNLVRAYLGCGSIDKAWYHARRAVLCDPTDQEAAAIFVKVFQYQAQTFHNREIKEEEIVEKLGTPDILVKSKSGIRSTYIYGNVSLIVENKRLVNAAFTGS